MVRTVCSLFYDDEGVNQSVWEFVRNESSLASIFRVCLSGVHERPKHTQTVLVQSF